MGFEAIFQQYWPKIYRVCMGYVNDHEIAQDLAQETFIIVWQKLSDFRGDAELGTWIYRIAANNCLKQIDKKKTVGKAMLPEHLPEEAQTDIEPRLQQLYQFISELPEIDRIIISLELEEVRQAAIARIVGISEGNLRVKIHRIKKLLLSKFRADEQ